MLFESMMNPDGFPFLGDGTDIRPGVFSQLTIGPMKYLVVEVSHLKDENGVQLSGQIDHGTLMLEIEAVASPLVKRHTLWRQALQTMALITGIELGPDQIDVLAYGIMQLLRDNPGLRNNP